MRHPPEPEPEVNESLGDHRQANAIPLVRGSEPTETTRPAGDQRMSKEALNEFEKSGTLGGKNVGRSAIILALMGAFLDGYDLLIIGVVFLTLIPQWDLSFAATGGLAASAFVGMVIGSAVFGVVADKVGRRAVFLIDMVIFIVGAVACGLAQNVVQLMIFRFFIGAAIGMDAPTSTSIIAEFSTNETRGRNTTLMQVFWPLGSAVASCIALLLYFNAGDQAWRWMFISGLIPAAIVLFLRKDLPETPFWLDAKKNQESRRTQASTETVSTTGRRRLGALKDLFHVSWLRPLLFVTTFWFLTNITGSSILVYMPFIAKQSFGFEELGAIIFSAGITFSYAMLLLYLAFKHIDKSGRRPMSIIGLTVASTMALVLSFINGYSFVTLAVFSLMAISLLAPGQGPFWAWSVEIMPTRLRATGQGMATSAGKVGSMIGVFCLPAYLDHVGWKGMMWTYFALFAMQLLLVAWVAPETKGTSLLALDQEDS